MLSSNLKSVATFVITATTSTSVTLSLPENRLIVIPLSAGVAEELSWSTVVLFESFY